ncbi:unnamed protein product [Amoebophrya sp. A25]|nr:unnamed protein product [Amoebophrya sp. A25]|eukprot:GSA25T00005255001.1
MYYGRCSDGKNCLFAHSEAEIRALPDFRKTRLCVAFRNRMWCDDGHNCPFAHNQKEMRLPLRKTQLCMHHLGNGCKWGAQDCNHIHHILDAEEVPDRELVEPAARQHFVDWYQTELHAGPQPVSAEDALVQSMERYKEYLKQEAMRAATLLLKGQKEGGCV